MRSFFELVFEFLFHIIFEVILEYSGAFVRYVLFRLRGKKIEFDELMPTENVEDGIFNEFANKIIGGMFLFFVGTGLLLIIGYLMS